MGGTQLLRNRTSAGIWSRVPVDRNPVLTGLCISPPIVFITVVLPRGPGRGSLSALDHKHCPLLLSSWQKISRRANQAPTACFQLVSGCVAAQQITTSQYLGVGSVPFWTLYMETSWLGQDLDVPVFLAIIASCSIRTSKPDSLYSWAVPFHH